MRLRPSSPNQGISKTALPKTDVEPTKAVALPSLNAPEQTLLANRKRQASRSISPNISAPSLTSGLAPTSRSGIPVSGRKQYYPRSTGITEVKKKSVTLYTDGTVLSPHGTKFTSENISQHWGKRMEQAFDKKELRAIGIVDKKQYGDEVKRIAASPTSQTIPGFIRSRDKATVRYETNKNLYLVADSRGRVITMFPPANGRKYFDDEFERQKTGGAKK